MDTIVEYYIYLSSEINISTIKQKCDEIVGKYCKDYIWQKETFDIKASEHPSGLHCLYGSTDVGENIDDEWLIVFLLYEISKILTDAVIQTVDSDGDYLLIEAANHLPSWITPASSDNRVFISNGDLHIIPMPSSPSEISLLPISQPTLLEAYNLVTSPLKTTASQAIQNSINEKIKLYPEKIIESFHHCHCYLPKEIVYVLNKYPHVISSAVQAFYERDPIDVKICRNMSSTFSPGKRILNCVKFSKFQYSQMMQANFQPDNKSDWRLPSKNDEYYKAHYMGYKLTCGFEILLSRETSSSNQQDNEPHGRFWEQYLSSLHKNGFFQDELEGSKKYKELLEKAKKRFKDDFDTSKNTCATSEIVELLRRLIEESRMHHDDIMEMCRNIRSEDDDDWMMITPDELDKMMLKNWSSYDNPTAGQGEIDNLVSMVNNMKSFVDNVSSYEGAENPDQCGATASSCEDGAISNQVGAEVDEGTNISKGAKKDGVNIVDNNKINFNSSEFMACIKELLDTPTLNDVSSETESETDYDDYVTCNDVNNMRADDEFNVAMQQMDGELDNYSVNKSFKNEHGETVDTDINLIKNFLESFSSQQGMSGPVSNMLQSMGVTLPPDDPNT